MMRAIQLVGVCLAMLVATSAGKLHGDVIERTAEIDLRLLGLPASEVTAIAPVPSFTLDVGDTFVFHLDFVGGDLRIQDTVPNNLEYIGFNFQLGQQTGFLFSGNFHFENVTGQLLLNDVTHEFGGPIGGFIPNANLTDKAFSFSGMTYTAVINYKEPGRPAFTSDQVEFTAITGFGNQSQPGTISVVASVPEPTSIAIWSLGLIGLAFVRHRRNLA